MIYNVLAIAFAVLALLSVVGAWVKRTKRVSFIWALFCAVVAASAAYYKQFWPVPVFGLMTFWALFTTLDVMTMNWRLKVGLTWFVALGAVFAIFPTVHDEILCSEKRGDAIPSTCPLKLNEMDLSLIHI